MLVSAIPDNKHAYKKFKNSPGKLIIDSGAFYYTKPGQSKKLLDIFEIQSFMVESMPEKIPIKLVHLDEPLVDKVTLSDKYKSIERTLFNAYEHMNLFEKRGFSDNVVLMGVIQGFDFASIQYSVFELKKMGFTTFGIGSLLKRSAQEQISIIKFASELVGANNLHVFGVTGIPQIKAMAELKVSSFDSSRPTMVAAYHQLIYSKPFRIYLLSESNVKKSQPRINKPLSCQCPICLENPDELMSIKNRYFTKQRSVHNYFHLVETINEILLESRVN